MNVPIELIRVRDGAFVDATLEPLGQKHLSDFETFWKHRLQASQEGDSAWDWLNKNRISITRSNFEKYAVVCKQITQGLMMIETQWHRSWFEEHRRIVYVDYLSTAPWNRRSICNPPEYRAVGGNLLEFARYRSQELGYGGLVGLHALPRAASFYRKVGMIDCGTDELKQGLRYFEWYRKSSSDITDL